MDRNEAIELLKDINLFLRCSLAGESRTVQAIDIAIEALGKDIDVPGNSALDHIHNVVAENEYKRGYEQGKADAIPVDWIEAEIKNLRAMGFELATMTACQIEAMLKKWREEQNGQTD